MNRPAIFPPDKLISVLEKTGEGALRTVDELDQLPPGKGAYLLVLAIVTPFDLAIKTLAASPIETGFYIYCGSAKGPGGIKARLKHHFSANKRKHWHIDHLSQHAAAMHALSLYGGDECDLTAHLAQTSGFTTPIAGFGASDCKNCQSHLLRWSENSRS